MTKLTPAEVAIRRIDDYNHFNALAARVHDLNKTWWHDPATGEPIERNFGEMIALVHSELSEALEAHRKNLRAEHIPDSYSGLEEEFADAFIRLLDIAGAMGLDLSGAFAAKLHYNAHRPDHKPENRLKDGGKKY